jgi:hypothetical protein
LQVTDDWSHGPRDLHTTYEYIFETAGANQREKKKGRTSPAETVQCTVYRVLYNIEGTVQCGRYLMYITAGTVPCRRYCIVQEVMYSIQVILTVKYRRHLLYNKGGTVQYGRYLLYEYITVGIVPCRSYCIVQEVMYYIEIITGGTVLYCTGDTYCTVKDVLYSVGDTGQNISLGQPNLTFGFSPRPENVK